MKPGSASLELDVEALLGELEQEERSTPLAGATWYTAHAGGDGLRYCFPAGTLAGARYLTADLMVDGNRLGVFLLTLQEGESGRSFGLLFSALNQCSARMRMPLEAVEQNRWRYEREAAWLKPMVTGDRVDLGRVDRMTLTVLRKSEEPVRWCMTPITATSADPPRIDEPVLPAGPLIDALGQSTLHEWPEKSKTPEELTARLHAQLDAAPKQQWPEGYSRWGGWTGLRFGPTGYFRTHHDGRRWWLVGPDGYAFWSAGMDCVRVDTSAAYEGLETALAWMPDREGKYAAVYDERGTPTINYLAANLIRAFGPEDWYDHWAAIALGELRRMGFNTVANWSDWPIAREAGWPYVRPLAARWSHVSTVFRDFPDVFAPGFEQDVAEYAAQLADTADDPAFIGYFLMNEPTWGFAKETPAVGMLHNMPVCATRKALAAFCRERYGTEDALAAAWECKVTFDQLREGPWHTPLNEAAQRDLADFSIVMVERLFKSMSDACRAVDPHHLNLGVRYYTVPPPWAAAGMRHFDVFSMNCYRERVPADETRQIAELLGMPVMVGEWHFGALDVGLPASGIGHVPDQAARGQAFRVYTEDAAA